jgi:prohibitin 1
MDDSDNDSPAGETPEGAEPVERPMQPIGGMVRDPREVKTNPSLTKFLRERMSAAFVSSLVAIGVLRPRTPAGDLGPRHWKGLFGFLGTIFAIVFVWTSIHIVPPGTVAVPVTLGHSGDPIGPGFHITLPFTTTYSMSVRVQNYTMSSNPGEGSQPNTDDSVSVLGSDGGAANVNATVLYRVDPKQATLVYKTLGRSYANAVVRPSARSCIRTQFTLYPMIEAATTDWRRIQADAAGCLKKAIEPRGLLVQDFQLREVKLDPTIQTAVGLKVASQQHAEQQQFELATAQQAADITRIQALATADSQQILACGGKAETIVRAGHAAQTVIPNPLNNCSQSQLTQQYLQFTYIQALTQLAASKGTTTLVLPFDKNLTPLINLGGSSSSGSTVVTPGK